MKNTKMLHLLYSIIIFLATVAGGGLYIKVYINGDVGSVKVRLAEDQTITINNVTNKTIFMKEVIQQIKQNKDASGELRALLEEHKLYQPADSDIVKIPEKPNSNDTGLKAVPPKKQEPVEEDKRIVKLSVPDGNHIRPGKAASCRKNPFFRRHVTVSSKKHRDRFVEVEVTGSFDCPPVHPYLTNLIQLSYADMEKLMGSSPLHRLEEGYVEQTIAAQ